MTGEKRDLDYFRSLLFQEQARLQDRIGWMEKVGLDASMTEATGELSSYDQHPADFGAEMFEREKDYGLRRAAKETLEQIDAALERMNSGTYGVCEQCGRAISRQRLEALPYASLCIQCAEEALPDDDRPAEEEVLTPPLARSFTDGTENVAFDGEDTWQQLASFGTANSPQDDTLYPKKEER